MAKILITGSSGYIGSALSRYLSTYHDHDVSGLDLVSIKEKMNSRSICDDYRRMSPGFYNRFDIVIHLAAHSSVTACTYEPYRAIDNNLTGFVELLTKLGRSQRFFYASSGSLYTSGIGGDRAQFRNVYDFTKYASDAVAQLIKPDGTHGLRFGTVCGVSPRMRWDLMLNGMVRSAVATGTIAVNNPWSHRPILAIGDLCRTVDEFLRTGMSLGPIENVASFETTVEDAANAVAAAVPGTRIVAMPDTGGYDFEMRNYQHISEPSTMSSVISELVDHVRSER